MKFKFRKYKDLLILPKEWSHYIVREYEILETFDTDKIVIENFIKSTYFIWQENRHNNLPIPENEKREHLDMNFHGFYNPLLLDFNDYTKTELKEFKQYFIDSIHNEIAEDPYVPSIIKDLNSLADLDSNYYLLNVKDPNKRHENTVYDFFYSGLIINSSRKTLTIVEFGLD